jgi:hypothetical protein
MQAYAIYCDFDIMRIKKLVKKLANDITVRRFFRSSAESSTLA